MKKKNDSESTVREIRRRTRKKYSAEEKIRIVLDGLRGEDSIAELCRRELAYSSLVIDACYTGDKDLALQALLLDPMVNDIDRARAILEDLLTEFAEYLPQFAG